MKILYLRLYLRFQIFHLPYNVIENKNLQYVNYVTLDPRALF